MDAQFMQNCPRSQTSEKLVADSMKWGKDKLQLNINIFQLMVEFDLSIFCMTWPQLFLGFDWKMIWRIEFHNFFIIIINHFIFLFILQRVYTWWVL